MPSSRRRARWRTTRRCATWRRTRWRASPPPSPRPNTRCASRFCRRTRPTRAPAMLEIRPGTGGRGGGAFRGRSAADVHPLRRGTGLECRDRRPSGDRAWRHQGSHGAHRGGGGLRPAEIRVRRAPGAARARDRIGRAHPHFGCNRGGPARSRGGGYRHPRAGYPHRHHARQRRGRPACEHDRFRRADHACSHRHRRDEAPEKSQHRNREIANGGVARAALRSRTQARAAAERAADRKAAGGLRRPVGAHPGPTTSRKVG